MYGNRDKAYTQEEKVEAWSSAAKMVETYSDAMVKRWKEEIDTYLVFAGLFSAVLTTFNVQSYMLLQPASPDASVAALQQISAQLASFAVSPTSVNSGQPSSISHPNTSPSPPVPRWAVWLNALWFSGLILSLSSASIGIMVKQWLNEYGSGVSGTSRPVARVRQYRLQNLQRWRVEDVVVAIPILLQLAVALFLAGILILLWNLHHTVAAIASTLVGLLAVFTIVTALLPLINHSCSYLSPQVRALSSIWQSQALVYCIYASAACWCRCLTNVFKSLSRPQALQHHVVSFGTSFARLPERACAAAGKAAMVIVVWCQTLTSPPDVKAKGKQTWQGREQSIIGTITHELDMQTLLEAYRCTLHPDALAAATVCLMDFDRDSVLDYFRKFHRAAREHFGAAADSRSGPLGLGNQHQMLWIHVLLCGLVAGYPQEVSPSEEDTAALCVYIRCGLWPARMEDDAMVWAMSAVDSIADHLEGTSDRELAFLNADWLPEERASLLKQAMRRDVPVRNVVLHDVSRQYSQVRLCESRRSQGLSDDTTSITHREYLRSVFRFLECSNKALVSSIPANDLKILHAYTQDVLTELTRILLQVVVEDNVRTTIDSTSLLDVMWSVRDMSDSALATCIPDDSVPDILRLAGVLATASEYAENHWVKEIQESALSLKAAVIRVKGEAAGFRTPQTLPARVESASATTSP